ncbi:MAG: hypothetical protein VB141_13500 [Burkholderia gladioli]
MDKDHACEVKHLSVERIAEFVGISADLQYKHLATGRMPANLILAYENVCGEHFVVRYLAAASGFLTIPVPTGRAVRPSDVQELQRVLNDAVGAILAFMDRRMEAADVLSKIDAGMNALAWHHGNVDKHAKPELELV